MREPAAESRDANGAGSRIVERRRGGSCALNDRGLRFRCGSRSLLGRLREVLPAIDHSVGCRIRSAARAAIPAQSRFRPNGTAPRHCAACCGGRRGGHDVVDAVRRACRLQLRRLPDAWLRLAEAVFFGRSAVMVFMRDGVLGRSVLREALCVLNAVHAARRRGRGRRDRVDAGADATAFAVRQPSRSPPRRFVRLRGDFGIPRNVRRPQTVSVFQSSATGANCGCWAARLRAASGVCTCSPRSIT